jgi:nucleotidyltransferase substrate binding protein (TIGR01987 family)
MEKQDLRWQQRFGNFTKALAQLEHAVNLARKRELSEIEQQGLIKAFEFTHELAWNVIKDFFEYQGNTNIKGSRDAIREAYKSQLISDGETWMETIKSRINSVHAYDESIASEIAQNVVEKYFPLFCQFKIKMQAILNM